MEMTTLKVIGNGGEIAIMVKEIEFNAQFLHFQLFDFI